MTDTEQLLAVAEKTARTTPRGRAGHGPGRRPRPAVRNRPTGRNVLDSKTE
ncbi:hypothetical protein ACF1BU_01265 [Streptomyces sp. NPDC014724]|uniref:hypothetical protein n=1 Tax=unclassified Streptomyces TaxID=2593676 RepID=UPI0036FC3CF3